MRYSFHWLVGFSILLTSCIRSDVAFAEGGVKSQTSQITIIGVRCVLPQPFCFALAERSRTLVLQSTQTEQPNKASAGINKGSPSEPKSIRAFRIIPTDLEHKDSSAIVPARWVTSPIDVASQVAPQKFISVPIQFDLKEIPKSGEYIGTLFVEHSGGDVAIPVTLRIKDSWHLAAPLLLAGVLLAFLLAIYQAEGFDRDEITVKVGKLRSQMKLEAEGTTTESETARVFQAKAESSLVDVATSLDVKDWDKARKNFLEARLIWDRWCKQRNAWIDLYEYVKQSLEFHLGNEIPEESVYGKDLRFEINRMKRDIADFDTPQKFSESLKPLKEKVQRFLGAKGEYEGLNALRGLMGNVDEQWQQSLIGLEDRLNRTSLDDEAGLKAWQDDADKLRQEMIRALKENNSSLRGASVGEVTQTFVRSVPTIQEQDEEVIVQKANWRLLTFRWVGQGVAIAILCGAGFNQLYVANPIFGANAIADYTSLFAWGFTAEVTRESVAKVLQRFRLPGAGG